MGHSRSSAVSPFDRAHTTSHSTLTETILYRFRDIASYLSRVADFYPPRLHLVPPFGATPVEFRGDLWHQITRVPELSCGFVCVILWLAVLVEHRLVTDRRTQGHSIYRACIASRGKNRFKIQPGNEALTRRHRSLRDTCGASTALSVANYPALTPSSGLALFMTFSACFRPCNLQRVACYSAPDRRAEYCDDRVRLFVCVCLSDREHIFGTARPIFTKFQVHVT